jgi:hypothetical protein
LSDPQVVARITKAIKGCGSNIVVGDPLSGFSLEDLNSDKEMLLTAREYGRIVRQGDQKRTPLLVQHARTGRSGAASAVGYDRGSYARNSKALHGWTRSQINLSPYNEENNDILVVASGKCNNAREFEPFAIELDKESMNYHVTDADLGKWKERVSTGSKSTQYKTRFIRDQMKSIMSHTVPMKRKDVIKQTVNKFKMSVRTAESLWSELKTLEEIVATEEGKWILAD